MFNDQIFKFNHSQSSKCKFDNTFHPASIVDSSLTFAEGVLPNGMEPCHTYDSLHS